MRDNGEPMFLPNKRGIAMVYVMICLIIIGMTATALIRLSHKTSITQIQYSNSESARLAVHSGFEKALSFFESTEEDSILSVLRAWADSTDPATIPDQFRWVAGTQNSYDSIYSDCKFKVQILGFDTASFSISLQSEGLTQTGHKASAIGTYFLDGLGFDADTNQAVIPINALHLGQGAGEVVSTLKVMNGDTWVDNPKSFFVSTGSPHEFHGLFMTASDNSTDIFKIKDMIFYDQVYIQCNTSIQNGVIDCRKGIGFENNVWTSGIFEIYGGPFVINGNYSGDGGTMVSGIHFKENYDIIGWDDKTFKTTDGDELHEIALSEQNAIEEDDSITNVKALLGVSKQEPPEINVDISIIPTGLIHDSRTLFGSSTEPNAYHINNAYKNQPLWNDFLVLKGRSSAWNAFGNGGTLNCKVIWIMENESTLEAPWNGMFEMSDTSLFLLYLDNTQVNNFRLPDNYRGFIYSDGSASSTPKHIFFGHNNEVHGGILIKDRTFRLQDDGGSFDVYYDADVINSFADLGLFVLEGDTDTIDTDKTLILTQERIESQLLSRSF